MNEKGIRYPPESQRSYKITPSCAYPKETGESLIKTILVTMGRKNDKYGSNQNQQWFGFGFCLARDGQSITAWCVAKH